MILDYFDDNFSGNSWEDLCDKCYRMRYQDKNYQKIPSVPNGDCGIEGYTSTGIAYQCYFPEKVYDDEMLYEHLRDKMTKDVTKLLDLLNAARLKSFGVKVINEWHFVIPEYKDNRILAHAENKKKEVLATKAKKTEAYDYISDEFIIVIKIAEDFNLELTNIIRNSLIDVKLNLAINHSVTIDWSKCDSEKVENIKRKVMAVGNYKSTEDSDFKDVVSNYVDAYIKGIELLNDLHINFSDVYEELIQLERCYKKEVSIKTKLNTDSSINNRLFTEIMNDFEQKLKSQFSTYLTQASILELKTDLIGSWLADCCMQFRRD
jgi:hypothetical protein